MTDATASTVDLREHHHRHREPRPMSARITFARDFDPTSRTLFGPLLSVGYCLNRENVAVDAFAWVDFAAPIHSGDSDLVPEAGAAVGGFYAGRL